MTVIKSIFAEEATVCLETSDAPEYEALIRVEEALVSGYMPPGDRNIIRKMIDRDTWEFYELDQRLCKKPGPSSLLLDQQRFEALICLRDLLDGRLLANEIRASEAVAAAERKQRLELEAQERMAKIRERTERLERDAKEMDAWWKSLSEEERKYGLKGVLLRLGISRKEMNEFWSEADTETRLRLMGMAMYALMKFRPKAKTDAEDQEPKPSKPRRRGHLKLVHSAAA